MKESDFPPGTKFFIKGADGPYAIFPGPTPTKFRTFSFASGTKASSAATGVNLRGRDVSVEEFLAEVEHCAREAAPSSKLKAKPLSVEERKSLDAKIDDLLKKSRAERGGPSDKGDFLHAPRGANGLPDPDAD